MESDYQREMWKDTERKKFDCIAGMLELAAFFDSFAFSFEFFVACGAILLHVANYNVTAQVEHHTRCFTKILGKNAVYIYAVYLVLSALVRDFFVHTALEVDQNTLLLFSTETAWFISTVLFTAGILLNLWTLKALGIKGMYNGDSFGFLMDAPVTGGPYRFFQDPQYVGTAWCMLSSAIAFQSLHGYILTIWLWIIFSFSVRFVEGPHMNNIYSNKNK